MVSTGMRGGGTSMHVGGGWRSAYALAPCPGRSLVKSEKMERMSSFHIRTSTPS